LAYSSGKDGQLFIDPATGEDANPVASARVKSWSLSASQDTIDTTFLGDTDRTFKEGVRSMSGNCEIAYYSDAAGESDAKTLIDKIFKPRTTATDGGLAEDQGETTLRLGFKNYANELKYISVKVLFTSMSITCSQGEIFTASGSFTVNGAPTEVSV